METEGQSGPQVSVWLESAQRHVQDFLCNREKSVPPDLGDAIIRCLRGQCSQLPLSYSFTPISELISLQHSPCVSLLGWSTDNFQTWSQEGISRGQDPPLARNKILPRVRLLLVGYISDQTSGSSKLYDGNLYFKDNSGSIPCEMSHLDFSLLETLVLLPCWSYIPSQHGSSTGGYLEVVAPPLPIIPPALIEYSVDPAALTPTSALLLLNDRSRRRKSLFSITGKLLFVTSLVNIRQKIFFCFYLEDPQSWVPVIVQVPSKLFWYHALCVGETYEITSLSMLSLRGSSRHVFAVTASSRFHSHLRQSVPQLVTSTNEQTEVKGGNKEYDHPQKRRAKMEKERIAKTLTYEGVLTRVLDARAGLYELDRKVTLCIAYLQLLNGGRGLREGATVQISNVHLQQSPSPLFSTLVLSCCLRSKLTVLEFSRICSPLSPVCAASALHLHLLFRYRLTLPEYLWMSDIMDKLQQKLCPRFVKYCHLSGPHGSRTQGVAENLLHKTLSSFSKPGERSERDLQKEILGEPHSCPLQTYSPLLPPWCLLPIAKLPSLVSDDRYLQTEESVRSLQWSYHVALPEDLPDRPVLVGVLYISSSGTLKLKDQTCSLPCLVLPLPPVTWIGSVLEVRQYQLVTEKVKNKEKMDRQRSKTYFLFLTHNVKILYPYENCPKSPLPTSNVSTSKKPRVVGPWASRLLLIEEVEGLLLTSDSGEMQFQARASWMGSPRPLDKEETDGNEIKQDKPSKVVLIFAGTSIRWHHFIQPYSVYRLIASGETDLEIFDKLAKQTLPSPHRPQCLTIPCEWTLQDVQTTENFSPSKDIISVEEVLKMRSTASLLNVTGVVSRRLMCDQHGTSMYPCRSHFPSKHRDTIFANGPLYLSLTYFLFASDSFLLDGVSIKVTLCEEVSYACVSVYLNVSRGPYPLGLLPGATVLLRGVERKVSRSGSVYLRSVPVTCVRILSPPAQNSQQIASPPLVTFAQLPGLPVPRRAVCLVSCVLSMTLSWDCSLCGVTFCKGSCLRFPSCPSKSGDFCAKASVKAEDGSGEVLLHLHNEAVSLMLGISDNMWEALKTLILSRGKVTVKNRGRTYETMAEEQSEDSLKSYLTSLMTSSRVCRPLVLTFTQRIRGSLSEEPSNLTRFTRGERDYITRVPSPATLTCLRLEEVEPRALCYLIRERNQAGCV
ncbi:CST complex subunit CTC1 isoform X1 [Pelobates fuscus]|uniref:CST complex subunit CTC1 isoform X1 n=1 Tax=Pelobates fuscus TaxID=191477 RepID=UPI002FE4F49B